MGAVLSCLRPRSRELEIDDVSTRAGWFADSGSVDQELTKTHMQSCIAKDTFTDLDMPATSDDDFHPEDIDASDDSDDQRCSMRNAFDGDRQNTRPEKSIRRQHSFVAVSEAEVVNLDHFDDVLLDGSNALESPDKLFNVGEQITTFESGSEDESAEGDDLDTDEAPDLQHYRNSSAGGHSENFYSMSYDKKLLAKRARAQELVASFLANGANYTGAVANDKFASHDNMVMGSHVSSEDSKSSEHGCDDLMPSLDVGRTNGAYIAMPITGADRVPHVPGQELITPLRTRDFAMRAQNLPSSPEGRTITPSSPSTDGGPLSPITSPVLLIAKEPAKLHERSSSIKMMMNVFEPPAKDKSASPSGASIEARAAMFERGAPLNSSPQFSERLNVFERTLDGADDEHQRLSQLVRSRRETFERMQTAANESARSFRMFETLRSQGESMSSFRSLNGALHSSTMA